MSKLDKWVGKEFTSDNIPEFLNYAADYVREKGGDKVKVNYFDYICVSHNISVPVHSIIADLFSGRAVVTIPEPDLTRTVYSPTGEAIKCPLPLSERPRHGECYFIEDITMEDFYQKVCWSEDPICAEHDSSYFAKGICYSTKEAAIANCKARYGIK